MKYIFDKRGMSFVKTAVIILIIAMLFSLMLSYAFVTSTVSRTRDDTQRVLDSFCIEKAIEIYSSIKNGNKDMVSGTYTTEFMAKLTTELGVARQGNNAYHQSRGSIIFRYDNPLVGNLKDDTLTLSIDYEIVVPISFVNRQMFDIRIPLRTESVYTLK